MKETLLIRTIKKKKMFYVESLKENQIVSSRALKDDYKNKKKVMISTSWQ